MQLTDTFAVDSPPDQLWEVLTDVERIAPCVPGFDLESVEGSEYKGRMKIKVGAITMRYDATIVFVERDDEARRAVIRVSGKESRGPGAVDATTTATLSGDGERTSAEMVTEVQVTGRIAQFGRGIIAEVSTRLTERFVDNLEREVLNPPEAPPADPATDPADSPPSSGAGGPSQGAESEPLDLAALSAVPVLKRVGPPLAALLIVLLVWKWRSR